MEQFAYNALPLRAKKNGRTTWFLFEKKIVISTNLKLYHRDDRIKNFRAHVECMLARGLENLATTMKIPDRRVDKVRMVREKKKERQELEM